MSGYARIGRALAVTALSCLGIAGLAAPASAETVTLPGCYGAGVVVCDPTVTVAVETYDTQVPVCAGSCEYVPVTLVRTTDDQQYACASADGLGGSPIVDECVDRCYEYQLPGDIWVMGCN